MTIINRILKDNEFTIEGIKHVYYNFGKSDSIFISFAGKINRYVSVTCIKIQY